MQHFVKPPNLRRYVSFPILLSSYPTLCCLFNYADCFFDLGLSFKILTQLVNNANRLLHFPNNYMVNPIYVSRYSSLISCASDGSE